MGKQGIKEGMQWDSTKPPTFPELFCLFSPLFYFILIDEPEKKKAEGSVDCYLTTFPKTAYFPPKTCTATAKMLEF